LAGPASHWATVGSAKKSGWLALADFRQAGLVCRLAGSVWGELGCDLVLTEQTRMKGSWATWGRKERKKGKRGLGRLEAFNPKEF
jgi:hypothetical protein